MSSILMTRRLSDFHPGARPRKLSRYPSCVSFRTPQYAIACWLGCLLTLGSLAAADAPWAGQYSLREWHAQDGLPSEDVTRVLQDRAGYLWMATSRGLARFDGVYFDSVNAELTQTGASIYIRAMAETAELGLVVAPSSGGTLAFKDGAFHKLDFARGRQLNSLFAEADGTLWASCEDRTVLRWRAGREEVFSAASDTNTRLVAFFALDSQRRLWIAGRDFLVREEEGRLVSLASKFEGTEFRVATSHHGDPWVLVNDRLYKMESDHPRLVMTMPSLVGAHYASSMLEDRNGTLWIGTRSQGLYAVVDGECRAVPTSGEAIVSLCEDTEGDLWAAANGGGLNRFRYRDFRLYDRTAGLNDNFSYTVCEDEQGSVWFGNRDGGVAELRNGEINVMSSWPGWPQFSVTSVIPDGAGKIWVTNGVGVFKINPAANNALEKIDALPARLLIRVAHVARNGDYWVGLDPDRVGRYRAGKFESFGPAEGYEGKQIRCIAEDESGNILIGTTDGRLIRYDGRHFIRVPLAGADEAPIQAIYPEPGGVTWVGTSGSGLYALRGGTCRHITIAEGLLDNVITAILPDDHGYLWFGSSAGIFSAHRKELADMLDGRATRFHAVLVGRDDGVRGLTCLGLYKPSAWKSRDGRLWFATRKGVLNFDPSRAISDVTSPPVFVADVKCDDEHRALAADGSLELSARVRKLEFRLSVLCLSTPDRVQIKYRLDGFDSQWVTAGADRIATYPRLPHGNYQLRAIVSLGNGVWNEMSPPLAITVQPLWWQTLWFQLVVAVALVALVVLVVRAVSHRRLRLRLERLERESAIERERARIARNIHDDLGASLTRISLLTQTAKRDGSTPESRQLVQIYETVRQITRSMDEIVWAVNPKNDHLDGLVSYLVSYAQSFLSVAGIRCRLDLPDHLPSASLTSQTRHNLYLCLKEALNNIVKHSGADEVTIVMRTVANSFTLTVSDNGRCHAHGNGNGNGHGSHDDLRIVPGQGLGNIAQRVAEMGGTCEFTPPRAGQGAQLSITILLGKVTPPPAGRLGRHLEKITP